MVAMYPNVKKKKQKKNLTCLHTATEQFDIWLEMAILMQCFSQNINCIFLFVLFCFKFCFFTWSPLSPTGWDSFYPWNSEIAMWIRKCYQSLYPNKWVKFGFFLLFNSLRILSAVCDASGYQGYKIEVRRNYKFLYILSNIFSHSDFLLKKKKNKLLYFFCM